MKNFFSAKIFVSCKNFFLRYRKAFLVLLFLISLAYLGAISYLYAWRIPAPKETSSGKISVDSVLYQKVMDNIKQREINFEAEAGKTYLDPFK
ncbi:MAG: hypothetical protein HY764_04140 [Candidatus Portnoybacteria bacterium]|nr:hypothetical protein [Candidatus Portnoybacteria bacterium]